MTRKRTVQLPALFGALQTALAENLSGASVHAHPNYAGCTAEQSWLRMLEAHLPRRYSVASAIVLDSRGRTSDQIDIVIHDRQYSFLPFHHNGHLYVAAESVYAVFEVKQVINAETLRCAADRAMSVRRLHRTNGAIHHAGGTVEKANVQPPARILAGLLATRSGWRSSVSKKVSEELAKLGKDQQLDLGCVAQVGAFGVEQAAAGSVVRVGKSEFALVDFLLDLLERLRLARTTPAIEFNEYARWVR